jgi:large repetitive protein
VVNNGPSAVTGAVLADPSVTGLDKSGVTCAVVPGQCVTPPSRTELESGAFALPTLAPGQSYAIVVTANVTAVSGSATNAAAVAVPGGVIDPVPANDGASDTDVVLPPPPPTGVDLAITASASASSVSPGGHLSFTLTLTNNGPAGVTNAVLTDIAPAGVTFGNWTCTVANAGSGGGVTTACGAASGTGNVTTTVTMQPGAVLTYAIAATVAANASGSVVDTASVNAPAGVTDSSPANNTSTAAVSVQAASAIAPQPIPALGLWGLIVLSLLMLVAAGGMRRRVQSG